MFYLKLLVLAFFGYAAIAVPNDAVSVNIKLKKRKVDSIPQSFTMSEAKAYASMKPERVIVKPKESKLTFEFDGKAMVFSNSDFIEHFDVREEIFLKVDFWKVNEQEGGRKTLLNKVTEFEVNKIRFQELGFYTVIFYQKNSECVIIYHFGYTDFGISPLETQIIQAQKSCD